jgi:hypothetical protein
MGFTVSFGNSGGGQMANWGFMMLILAIFLFFTGLWRKVGDAWTRFFSSSLWQQTIGNAKATWQTVPAQELK